MTFLVASEYRGGYYPVNSEVKVRVFPQLLKKPLGFSARTIVDKVNLIYGFVLAENLPT